jgi:hypothetical protein
MLRVSAVQTFVYIYTLISSFFSCTRAYGTKTSRRRSRGCPLGERARAPTCRIGRRAASKRVRDASVSQRPNGRVLAAAAASRVDANHSAGMLRQRLQTAAVVSAGARASNCLDGSGLFILRGRLVRWCLGSLVLAGRWSRFSDLARGLAG